MSCKYSIIPIILESTLNPGDTLKIRVFVTGYGEIKHNKLFINHHPTLISKENPGKMRTCIKLGTNEEGKQFALTGKKYIQFWDLEKEGAIVGHFVKGYFLPLPNTITDYGLPQIHGETIPQGLYPLEIDLNISKECPPGDYLLNFDFTYEDDEDIYQDKNVAKVHVKSWLERHKVCITIVTIGLAILGIIIGAIMSM
jgi:hypothetical protein